MAEQFSVVTQSIVTVRVTSSGNTFGSERRFQKDLTVAAVKGKLELVTGSIAGNMKLEAYNKDDKLICKLDDNEALLGSYPVDDGMRLHVVDATIKLGEFEDTSKVEKFEISEDSYAKRTDSVRAFKERNKMGRFQEISPEEQKKLDEEKAKKAEAEKQKAESLHVGDRCEVRIPAQPVKRGQIKYVGLTDFKEGLWAGVQYDEPVGKNDGSVKGKRYFDCPAKYGGFARVNHLEVGDFPEEDLDFSDDEI
ncbi:tubulin-folding cofactor B-like [Mizuhopecten yessoensis]|uniref:Tubulin-folding cofactor B n=1 Tax=Mizuhopecten yessoensis TaxID=6573 RepID=A0A210QAF2_MIZYE|nr:tubulin-folding cofactor B-like [Mizuhopecten yessoensis]OWF45699.1 Tubulin-folding cofactor B [Mizuhopecten yessoensis]